VFFVIHGAEMNLTALAAIGGVGAVYVVLRLVGKYLGTFWAAGKRANEPGVRRWLGATLFSQAGAAIVLVSMATDPANGLGELGVTIQTIILGMVIIFEILGPIMIRMAVLRTGEVPIDQAIHHTSTTPLEELTALIDRVKAAVGLDPWKRRSMGEIKVNQLM
jgi:Kef-type K+ transport system membrane component KefB